MTMQNGETQRMAPRAHAEPTVGYGRRGNVIMLIVGAAALSAACAAASVICVACLDPAFP